MFAAPVDLNTSNMWHQISSNNMLNNTEVSLAPPRTPVAHPGFEHPGLCVQPQLCASVRLLFYDRMQLLVLFMGGLKSVSFGKVSLRLRSAGLRRLGRFTCCRSSLNTSTTWVFSLADAST